MPEEELKQQDYAQHNSEYPPPEPQVQDKSQFEPWVSANVEKLLSNVDVEERDLVDDIDMFYPLDKKVAPLLISEELKEGEIPYADHSEKQNHAI